MMYDITYSDFLLRDTKILTNLKMCNKYLKNTLDVQSKRNNFEQCRFKTSIRT